MSQDLHCNYINGEWVASSEVIENIRKIFKIEHPRPIQRINLNTAGQEDFVKIPFLKLITFMKFTNETHDFTNLPFRVNHLEQVPA